MSAVIAEATPAPVASKRGKKLIIIGMAALLLLSLLGGGAFWLWKKRAHAAHDEEDGGHAKVEVRTGPPTWLPLDPFVVNLSDRDADRYAQIGVTLEVENAAAADQVRAWMPAVRNSVLMILAGKSTKDLLDRAGKEQLADEIQRESARAMGIAIAPVQPVAPAPADKPAEDGHDAKPDAKADAKGDAKPDAKTDAKSELPSLDGDDDPVEAKPKKSRPEKPAEPPAKNPVLRVHFSSFIVQ